MNQWCYNGLVRFNRKGEFNSPAGRYPLNKDISFVVADYVALLTWQWSFISENYTDTGFWLKHVVDNGGLVFVDPPYLLPSSKFSGYSKHSRDFDHVDFANWMTVWAYTHEPRMMITHEKNKFIYDLLIQRGFDCVWTQAGRPINCKAEQRKSKEEMIFFRNIDKDILLSVDTVKDDRGIKWD